jgi:uncharacterized membrane-anchored protein
MKKLLILLLVFPLVTVSADKAKPPSKKSKAAGKEAKKPEEMAAEEFEAQLKYQRGVITIGNGLATLSVPDTFRYLNPEQSELIIVQAWGNPPGLKTLGMLFPSDVSPLNEQGWGVVITYEEDGYVKDDEAEGIDYTEMLSQMKQATVAGNQERRQQGFPPIELVGWAAPPRYDKTTHKLYWAKELKFDNAIESTLNYDIRALGRKGVLSFNAVASMGQLGEIENRMKDVLGFAEFTAGNRYSDFDPGYDKIAAYGIGALIAGKIALKVGFFKLILGALLAAKKLVILGLVALAALLRKLFKKKPTQVDDPNSMTTLNLDQ